MLGDKAMKRLVLLRHGESTWNKENRFTGWTDVGLTEKGVLCCAPQFLLDAQQLVVFFHPFTPGGGTGLKMSGIQSNGHIGDKAIHGLTASV